MKDYGQDQGGWVVGSSNIGQIDETLEPTGGNRGGGRGKVAPAEAE